MKALTLHQPWASLVSLGVKTIETRGWSTKYRGPLAIHAAKRLPNVEMLEDGPAGELHGGDAVDSCLAQWFSVPACDFDPARIPPALQRWCIAIAPSYDIHPMPLGAVIATCELVDVVPMIDGAYEPIYPHLWLPSTQLHLWLVHCGKDLRNVTDQRPYGDFAPGRSAWLLTDIKPCGPYHARGEQGIWDWDTTFLAGLEGITA